MIDWANRERFRWKQPTDGRVLTFQHGTTTISVAGVRSFNSRRRFVVRRGFIRRRVTGATRRQRRFVASINTTRTESSAISTSGAVYFCTLPVRTKPGNVQQLETRAGGEDSTVEHCWHGHKKKTVEASHRRLFTFCTLHVRRILIGPVDFLAFYWVFYWVFDGPSDIERRDRWVGVARDLCVLLL